MRAKIAKMCESNKKQRVDRKRAENEIIVEDMTEEEYSSLMNESVLLQTKVEDEVDDTDSYFLQPLDVSQRSINDLCWHKDAGKQSPKLAEFAVKKYTSHRCIPVNVEMELMDDELVRMRAAERAAAETATDTVATWHVRVFV